MNCDLKKKNNNNKNNNEMVAFRDIDMMDADPSCGMNTTTEKENKKGNSLTSYSDAAD